MYYVVYTVLYTVLYRCIRHHTTLVAMLPLSLVVYVLCR